MDEQDTIPSGIFGVNIMLRRIRSLTLVIFIIVPMLHMVTSGFDPLDGKALEIGAPAIIPGSDEMDQRVLTRSEQGFMENNGQISREDILYYGQGDLRIGFARSKLVFCLDSPDPFPKRSISYEVIFRNSNDVLPTAGGNTGTKYNFFGCNNHGSVRSDSYDFVIYPDLYDGIDLKYFYKEDSLKYEFYVHPGGDPSLIRMEYLGVSRVDNRCSSLSISTLLGTINDENLIAFQGEDNVPLSFFMENEFTVGFQVSDYDRKIPLIIDPYVKFSTYLGGSQDEYKVTKPLLDDFGNIYLAGAAFSNDFPTTIGVIDTTSSGYEGFLTKFSPDLTSVIFSTFIGGSKDDEITDMYLSTTGEVFITGHTYSTDFPVTSGSYDERSKIWTDDEGSTFADVFVSKIIANGTILSYSTFIGGNGNDGGTCIDIDTDGYAYVGGYTFSENFPTLDPYQSDYKAGGVMGAFAPDGFVLKLNPAGSSLEYSTYLGGSHNRFESGIDTIKDIIADDQGRPIVCGQTGGFDFPTTSGAYNEDYSKDSGFVTRLANNGSALDFSTFIDGSTICNSLLIEDDGDILITGTTQSDKFPVSNNAFDRIFDGGPDDGFIMRLYSDGSGFSESTFLGGTGPDESKDIKMDDQGNIWVCGDTLSDNFPITHENKNFPDGDSGELFISRLSLDLSTLGTSFKFGGSDYDISGGIAFDHAGEIVITGATSSIDLPTSVGAYDITLNNNSYGRMDLFTTRFIMEGTLPFPPTDLGLTIGGGHLNLTWTPPERAEIDTVIGYRIQRSSTGSGYKNLGLVNAERTWFNDTGLTNGQEYFYVIRSVNFVGDGARSEAVSGIPLDLPTVPMYFRSLPGDGYIDLLWDPPSDDGGDANLNYMIKGGTDPDSLVIITTINGENHYHHQGLENGKTYYYQIAAANSRGVGLFSEMISDSPGRAPSNPIDLNILAGDGFLNLSWKEPADDGCCPDISYSVYLGFDNSTFLLVEDEIIDEYYNMTGLKNGIIVYLYVIASNRIGEGMPSFVLSSMPMGLPSDPRDLQVKYWSRMIELKWVPPISDGGAPDMRYDVWMGTEEFSLSLIQSDIETTRTRVEDLKNGVRYYFGVSASNLMGDGPISNIVTVTPMGVPSKPLNFSASPSEEAVWLNWSVPIDLGGAGSVEYRIFYGTNYDSPDRISVTGSTSIMIENLINGDEYYFQVRCENSEGAGPISGILSAVPMGRPSTSEIISITSGDGMLSFVWIEPVDLGGSPDITYNIYLSGLGKSNDLYATGVPGLNYTVEGLENGRTYFIRVSAVNSVGEGQLSDRLPGVPMTIPSAPLSFELFAKGNTITLSWAAPQEDGGSPIQSYLIYRGETKDGLALHATLDNSSRSYIDDSIIHDREYFYRISSINEKGEGPPSSTVSGIIESDDAFSAVPLIIGGMVAFILAGAVSFIVFFRKKSIGLNQEHQRIEDHPGGNEIETTHDSPDHSS